MGMHSLKKPHLLIVVLMLVWLPAVWADAPYADAVASAHPLATEAGLQILKEGGNAFDAAVAVTAALAVVEPYSSGLGGGGFFLLHRARDNYETMLDAREKAPLSAQRALYLDEQGNVIPGLSVDGPLAAAIPGTPAALAHLAEHYGRLPLSQSLAPAIKLAEQGFPVDRLYRNLAEFRLKALQQSQAAAAIFLHDGQVPALCASLKQPDLANTLQTLARRGAPGFYAGPLAEKMVEQVRAAGGIWSSDDLANYQVLERAPVRGNYRGIRITSAAPPSSGGVALLTMLNILAGYDLQALPEAQRTHLIIEAMRRAYRDRAEFLGDPDYTKIDVAQLTHPFYGAGLRATINPTRATPSASLPGVATPPAGIHTTHFSVLDRAGNRVAATLTINFPFGSGFVVPGTGVLLNDEMDDFSAKPGTPNLYGLIGGEANAIAPGKRPLSSMTPTFLESERGVAILGTPGGSRIITMVLLATLDFADGLEPQAWVQRARFHHQFLPDTVEYEPRALAPATVTALAEMGHQLKALDDSYGNMQAILWERRTGTVAVSDPRGIGKAAVRSITRLHP